MDYSYFESKAHHVHGNRYRYHLAEVTHSKRKVDIECPDHGVFKQAPDHHLRGRGCPICARENRKTAAKVSSEDFFAKASEIHEGFYDYSRSEFKGLNEKVSITCPVHGEFSTLARKHISEKRGCPDCGRVRTQYAQSVFFQDFFDAAVDRHGFAYSYVDVSLKYLSDEITVKCKEHGSFKVTASKHLHGVGCPKCRPGGSSPENEVAEYIESLGMTVVRNSRDIIAPLELDVVLPELKIAFEFNGIYWHSEQNGKSSQYHQRKTLLSKRAGFRLFHIYESDWDLSKDSIKERIRTILFPEQCPGLDSSYCIEEYSGHWCLINKGKVLCRFRKIAGLATDVDSPLGLAPLKRLMELSGVLRVKSNLDWPEFSPYEYFSAGFKKRGYLSPDRLYFDKKTLRRLKNKPEHSPGFEYYSVVDSGSVIWGLD